MVPEYMGVNSYDNKQPTEYERNYLDPMSRNLDLGTPCSFKPTSV